MALHNDKAVEIDLFEFGKFIYRKKYFVLLCTVLGLLIGIAYAFKTVTPVYQTTIEFKLPLYCDDRTVNTAQILAKGKKVLDSVNQQLELPEGKISVNPKVIDKTTLISVDLKGTNPELIKLYADTYQNEVIKELNQFVNDQAIKDFKIASLKENKDISISELKRDGFLRSVEITKDAEVPTKRVDYGFLPKILVFLIGGAVLGVISVLGKYIVFLIN